MPAKTGQLRQAMAAGALKTLAGGEGGSTGRDEFL